MPRWSQQLAGNAALLPQDVIAEIVERTDGVPLFVEEMTKAVLEAGAERGREIAASVPSATLGVPATLQASLMARLDRLGPAAKGLPRSAPRSAANSPTSWRLRSANLLKKGSRRRSSASSMPAWSFSAERPPRPNTCSSTRSFRIPPTALCCVGPRQQLHARIAEALEANSPRDDGQSARTLRAALCRGRAR